MSAQQQSAGAQQPLKTAVEQLLRPTEACRLALELQITGKDGRKRTRIFAIVLNTEKHEEACVFILEKKGSTVATIQEAVPIFSDFKFAIVQAKAVDADDDLTKRVKADHLLKVSSDGKEIIIELGSISLDDTKTILVELKPLIAVAVERNFRGSGVSHSWVQYYSQASPSQNAANPSVTPHSSLAPRHVREISNTISPSSSEQNLGLSEHLPADFARMQNPFMSGHEVSFNPDALRGIKEAWVSKQLQAREQEFTEYRNLKFYIGTWNVNGKYANEDMGPWLNDYTEPPDIYALGFQEIDLSAEAFLLNDTSREDFWTKKIETDIRPPNTYVRLISKQLVGMLIVIMVKKDIIPHIKDVAADTAGCGIMGMMGNKGGVAVRLRVFDSYVTFVNSHLAADTKELERRNQDYQEICRRIAFPPPMGSTMLSSNGVIPQVSTIFDSDHLIWFGDLNYRVPLPDTDVKEMLKSAEKDLDYRAKALADILRYDQLNIERKAKRAFGEFEEPQINFLPSYKFDPGTSNYDSSEKKRTPAWCDRVLYRRGDELTVRSYKSHYQLLTSDHKPVSAIFDAKIKVLMKDRQAEVHQAIVRELDKFENECMPDAVISSSVLDFGTVRYLHPATESIVIENCGQVSVRFAFIPKLEDKQFCKPWLWVLPPVGFLVPGEKLRINLTALVDSNTAPALNMGRDRLEDILILHLENGKDYFISVTGKFLLTCFGVPLDVLVRLGQPIRNLRNLSEESLAAQNHQVSIPRELWRIVDYIYNNGMNVDNLFLSTGNGTVMDQIRESLDSGVEFPNVDVEVGVHSMAETLLHFLKALPEPVIPFNMYQKCIDSAENYPSAKTVIQQLPTVHHNVFVYLTAFLREVISHKAMQRLAISAISNTESPAVVLDARKLATIFSAVLLRPPQTIPDRLREISVKKSQAFLIHFLVDNEI